jgi:hypothetical protein
MDDNAPQEKSLPADLNKIDLSQLSGFSFGTSWVQDKSTPNERRSREGGDDRPRRDAGGAPDRRDRRGFSRPAGGPGPGGPAGPGGGAPERREFSGERPSFPREGGGEFRGAPRRDFQGGQGGGGGDRGERGERFGGRGQPVDRGPYDSPWFSATFYPEDTSFSTLVQTIRKSCRTIELFEVARTVVAKVDRFVVVLARRPNGESGAPDSSGRSAPAGFYVSVPDGLPFETEEAALNHVLTKHLGLFFDSAEVTIDPPKGNFQVVNRCGVTGELIGPPNFHRYNQLVQQHYAARVDRMPFEAFKSRIESVREPEVIQAWLDKMKKTTRYTWKTAAPAVAAAAAESAESVPASGDAAPAETAVSASADAPVETAPVVSFDSFDEAKAHLLTTAKDKVIRPVEQARLHGKNLELLPPGEIRAAIEGALERQRRFPLDTANALRGRLRREHLTIFKKGSKGVSYVCAVKRKFRVPGQVFSDSIGALISFIEMHPMVKVSELGKKFLNVQAPPSPVEGQPAVEHVLTPEQREKLSKMQSDLPWLVREGYVTEFIDGALYAPLAMAESKKREVEASEHDPENFPDAPAPAAREAAKAPVAPVPTELSVPEAEVIEPTPAPAEVAPTAEASPAAEETPKSEPPSAPAV